MAAEPIRSQGWSGHEPECQCTRCRGFEAGNGLSVRHGAYASPTRLSARVEEIAASLVPLVPAFEDSDGPAVKLLALALSRIERGEQAVAAAEENGDLAKLTALRGDLRGWVNSANRLLDALGMTPTSRARLGLDLAAGRREMSVVEYYRARERAGLPAHDEVT
jgi:hypothetical protein